MDLGICLENATIIAVGTASSSGHLIMHTFLYLSFSCLPSNPSFSSHVDGHCQARPLLEDFAIRPLVSLAIDLDWLFPAPLIVDIFLIFLLGGIKLGELV